MSSQIRVMKLIGWIAGREVRSRLAALEGELAHLVGVVDQFYAIPGPRHWVFHDTLSIPKVETLLNATDGPEASEQAFIELYRPGSPS